MKTILALLALSLATFAAPFDTIFTQKKASGTGTRLVAVSKPASGTYAFTINGSGDISKLALPGGGFGDVTGPGSSADNRVARFDGATGKTLQNSAVAISDSGEITGASSIFATDTVQALALSVKDAVSGNAINIITPESLAGNVTLTLNVAASGNLTLNGDVNLGSFTQSGGNSLTLTTTATTNSTLPAGTKTLLATDGSGASLTSLNASNISSGTLAITRIADASVTNAKLANSSMTINGSARALGDTFTVGDARLASDQTFTGEQTFSSPDSSVSAIITNTHASGTALNVEASAANGTPLTVTSNAGTVIFSASGGQNIWSSLTANTHLENFSWQGITDASNATAGDVGQVISSAVAAGSAVGLTTATDTNVTSISLTAGDWDVTGNINVTTTTATTTGSAGGITVTSATIPSDGTEVYSGVQVTLVSGTDSVTLPRKRVNVNATTTVYLVGRCTFSAGSVAAFGSISARRVR